LLPLFPFNTQQSIAFLSSDYYIFEPHDISLHRSSRAFLPFDWSSGSTALSRGGETIINNSKNISSHQQHQTGSTMAVNIPLSPSGKPDVKIPPSLLQSRAGNELYDRPVTPTRHGFTSPAQTPQGSPSKNKQPPGAIDLPNVFENAMKLTPSSPTKSGYGQPSLSPTKGGLAPTEDPLGGFNESVIHKDSSPTPGTPTRKSNKENTPPGALRLGKDSTFNANQAAISRQEPYQQREPLDTSSRKQAQIRGLTPEEREKLQLPKVKRLANVTQLC
jgi:cell cycle protein kinase DBF2